MFYERLNQLIDQIEQNLDSEIDYAALARSIGINLTTLQKFFPLVADVSLAEYVRKRRLTLAGKDLAQSDLRIIDVALKYGYNSAAAFSRAFYSFHQVKPSVVKSHPKQLSYFPKLTFTKPEQASGLSYEIIELPALDLRGYKIMTNLSHIRVEAPALFRELRRQHPDAPHPDFGMLDYLGGRDDDDQYAYYVLWDAEHAPGGATVVDYHLPSVRWLKFQVPSYSSAAIQSVSHDFYERFLPTCEYRLRPEPDLEYYHDGVTDFLIPIY